MPSFTSQIIEVLLMYIRPVRKTGLTGLYLAKDRSMGCERMYLIKKYPVRTKCARQSIIYFLRKKQEYKIEK
jgi:hypothetical protein